MTTQMGCAEAVRRLWEYLDGGLDHADHEAVDAHLSWCRRCCGELALAEELRRLLRTKTRSAVPRDAEERLERFIDGLDDIIDRRLPDERHRT